MIADLLRTCACAALTMSAAIALVLCLRRPLRVQFGARVAYALWLVVPLAGVVAWLPARVVVTYVSMPASAIVRATAAPAVSPAASTVPVAWLAVIWAFGAGIALALAARQQRRFVHRLGRLTPQDGSDVWRAESAVAGPALVGALRPRIVVPSDFETRYDSRERELVLAHERLHRARGDAQINALATLVRCALWFDPLVYIAAPRFRFDQELACDAAVMARFPRARRRYAEAMLNTQLADLGLPAGCHWQSCHPLKERIAMLKQHRPSRLRTLCGMTCAALLVAGGSYAAWATQPANIVARTADAPIRGDISLRIDGGAERHLTIVTPPNAEFAVAVGEDASRWELRGTATPHADGTIDLAATVRHGDTVVGSPRLHVQEGSSGGMNLGDGAARFDAGFVLTRADAAAAVPEHRAAAAENAGSREVKPPHYPEEAVRAHQQGHVVLRVHVDEHGNPQTAQVAEADPAEAGVVFSQASVAAAMQWRYNPASVDGKAVAGDVAVPIDYVLVDDED